VDRPCALREAQWQMNLKFHSLMRLSPLMVAVWENLRIPSNPWQQLQPTQTHARVVGVAASRRSIETLIFIM